MGVDLFSFCVVLSKLQNQIQQTHTHKKKEGTESQPPGIPYLLLGCIRLNSKNKDE